jgi:hypothetical protein
MTSPTELRGKRRLSSRGWSAWFILFLFELLLFKLVSLLPVRGTAPVHELRLSRMHFKLQWAFEALDLTRQPEQADL